jgi:hypothetical protein
MVNIIMMVPDTLSTIEAVNSPKWALPPAEKEIMTAAKHRIRATRQMNRCSDEQILKSKQLMLKGLHKSTDDELEPETEPS